MYVQCDIPSYPSCTNLVMTGDWGMLIPQSLSLESPRPRRVGEAFSTRTRFEMVPRECGVDCQRFVGWILPRHVSERFSPWAPRGCPWISGVQRVTYSVALTISLSRSHVSLDLNSTFVYAGIGYVVHKVVGLNALSVRKARPSALLTGGWAKPKGSDLLKRSLDFKPDWVLWRGGFAETLPNWPLDWLRSVRILRS